jgi:hypothetical protein
VPLLAERTTPRVLRSRWRWRLLLALAALGLVGVSLGVGWLLGIAGLWTPALLLAGACLGCLFLSFPQPGRLLGAVLAHAGRPRLQGAALLVTGLGVCLGWAISVQQQGPPEHPGEAAYRFGPTPGQAANKERTAWTDRGAPIPLCDVGLHKTLPEDEAAEASMIQAEQRALRLIRTAPASRDSNCHGWVFTGGRYLIDGGHVERILTDNGYHRVTTPRPGDLAIYRSKVGHLAHSAVVRMADNGLVLLESKWGHLGRYLHKPEDYCFAVSWNYYRSSRTSHLLRGLEDNLSEGQPAPSETK